MAQASEVFLFQPTSIPGCQLWLDAADVNGNGTSVANGATVSTWVDKSGNTRNATGTGPPTYDAATRYVLFNGSSQFFTLPNGTYPFGNTPYSIFVVAYTRNAANPQWVLAGGTSITNQAIGMIFFTTNAVWHTWWVNEYRVDNSIANNVPAIINISYSTLRSIVVNGGTPSTNNPAASRNNANSPNYIGRRADSAVEIFNGGMAECIVYNSEIPTSQRQQVEGYLAWKWGLVGSLPSNHPFKTYRPLAATPIPTSIPPMPITGQTIQPFLPTQVPNINAWYDGADPLGTGILPTLNVSLATWFDKSGNGRNASGGTSPTFVTGGVSFNGTSQFYNFSVPYSSNYSIFLVATNTTAAQCYYFSRSTVGAGQPSFIQGYIGSGIGLEWFEGNDRATIALAPVSPFLASVDHTQGTNIVGWYFGNQSFTIPQTQAYNSAPWDRLGQAGINVGWYGGIMRELIFYNAVVTTTQRQQIEGYLAWKWGLQANLPNGHPFRNLPPTPFPFRTTPFRGSLNQWQPSAVSGCVLWLDAADRSTISLSASSVTQWRDKSASGYTFVPGASPTSGVNTINGLNVITTNGSQHLQITNYSQNFTAASFFCVFRPTQTFSTWSFLPIFMSQTTGAPYFYPELSGVSPFNYLFAFGVKNVGGLNLDMGLSSIANNTYLITGILPGNASNFGNINGSLAPSSGTGSALTSGLTNVTIYAVGIPGFGSEPRAGQYGEMIMFNRAVSTQERQQVEGYLAWKWGLQGSLPANHPFRLFPPSP